ncbi:hypothetical protein A0H81_07989 [Grifola frondosa]|uniref:4a-hydroxytetrahydrobiopterin dehydratase n=1 Tax=Grifola frondosa TaxID=5627 RepID=A0A1C7M7K2_GRIFR|nr:hypothetical protein A0H81_07989 [Grifola frondosa]
MISSIRIGACSPRRPALALSVQSRLAFHLPSRRRVHSAENPFANLWQKRHLNVRESHKLLDVSVSHRAPTETPSKAQPTSRDPKAISSQDFAEAPQTNRATQATTRSKETLPPAPKWPCPHLTDAEITEHLVPLYTKGWTIRTRTLKDPQTETPTPELAKKFLFRSPKGATAFLRGVDYLADLEHHHPETKTETEPERGCTVDLAVHTHSAIRPSNQPGESVDDRSQPGVTLRDVRYANLCELLFAIHVARNQGLRGECVKDPARQPATAAELEALRTPAFDGAE